MSVAKIQRQALEKTDLQGSNFEPKRQTEWHALHRRESLMRRWGQFDVDGVAGEDQAARNNNSHHTSFADEFAVGISSEDCGH